MIFDNMAQSENNRYIVQVYVGALSALYEALSVEASKQTTSEEIVSCIVERLSLNENPGGCYELAEVIGDTLGQECKERRLGPAESPVQLMMLWPKVTNTTTCYRFYLREKLNDYLWTDSFSMDPQLIKDYFQRFLYQPKDREYPDLCQLPDLNELTLLENLRARFTAGHIYTYVGSILIAVNPFKFHPIYNPKYVKLYQNRRLGPNLPPHIFAVADTAYHCMLKDRKNQCIVISGESGSGKTESTNFLLHHLTALSQKGSHGSGVEQTILSAGPVLEAFGNAKTAHNNNSSRFGKFIQVNYKENGMVHGAVVQKYLLEKSRICSQGRNERNYHVFYYLLAGANELERASLHLKTTEEYNYLNRSGCYALDNVDESHEFSRLKQSMEMVGFTSEKQRRLFSVLSAVLLLGNVEFQPRKSAYHHDEAVAVKNPEIVQLISNLLRVKQETLLAALTAKRAKASGETLVIYYRLPEAIASRDAMAKCLYGALFDWIVLQVNHALLAKKDTLREHQGNSIGVLDIFGFEDFGLCNSFEQLCINYANEHLQYYFNQHVFKYEQEEYRKEGIRWNNIDFMDNTGCLQLIEGKPNGLLCVLDDQCNFPGATNETLLQKFNTVHKVNEFYEKPQKLEAAFLVIHYAGKVKYQVTEMREKNLDLMRQDIVGVLKNSSMAFVRELVGADPVAVFRWAIVRAFFRAYFAFHEAGRKHRQIRTDGNKNSAVPNRFRNHTPNENIIRKNKSFRPRERTKKGLKNLQTVKTLAGRTGITGASQGQLGKARKQPLTVAAQFQQSLHSLMDTLNQANPFFIRCIKSNGNKIPNQFDDETVQRQLRYTGMLETVRIRQAGFNVRLTYDEFIQLYRILLPKGLLSSQNDVRNFLATLNLNRDNYQLGSTKIFLRESEKIKLDCKLHQQIMASIVTIQRWFRVCLERRRFVRLKNAVLTIQSFWRMVASQKVLSELRHRMAAAVTVQSAWRAHKVRLWYRKMKVGLLGFQAHAKGFIARRMVGDLKIKCDLEQKVVSRKVMLLSPVRLLIKPDVCPEETFLSTESSQEELDDTCGDRSRVRDSDESSGILEDADLESLQSRLGLRIYPNTSTTHIKLSPHTSNFTFVSPNCYKHTRSAELPNFNCKPDSKIQEHIPNSLKSSKSSEFSSGIYIPHRKGSCDSLVSLRSLELPKSTDTHQNLTATKSEVWETHRSDGELDLDTDSTKSAPPIISRDTYFYPDLSKHTHTPLAKAQNVNKQLVSLPPVRRDPRLVNALRNPEEKIPEVPLRNIRKPRRDVRSAGEELSDIAYTEAKNQALLSTISETSVLPADSGGLKRVWKTHKELEAVAVTTTSETDGKKVHKRPRGQIGLELRRRNSDPATKLSSVLLLDVLDPGKDIEMAGHRFKKVPRFSNSDRCFYCREQMDPFVSPGYKCVHCKKMFHTICIQNGCVSQLPCGYNGKPGRKKYRKHSQVPQEVQLGAANKSAVVSKFSLTGTSEFTDRTDQIISDARELQLMQDFITNKICKMESQEGKKPSEVDRVFKQALREFKDNLIATYSVVNKQSVESISIKYKDLIGNFLQVMENVCHQEQKEEDFPVTMGVNAFRGFMNEFMTSRTEAEKPKAKRKKEKKRKVEEAISFAGHSFLLTIINIPTACEICSSFFMWPIERGLVCQSCKFTVHKKCYTKVTVDCGRDSNHGHDSKKVFGVPLPSLLTGECKIPVVLDRLITTIELHGLYTEGIYRKSGVSSKVRELKTKMEEHAQDGVDFESYQMHVLASVLKSFLREMPEPLLTFDCYEDFLRAASLTDPTDRVSTLFEILRKLPKPNFDLMERIIFHLARVALHEDINRMNASALAIVFAPCVLRTNKVLPAQDSLNDISRQTQCIETILMEQLRKVRSTLADIDTLDTACHTATNRLSSLRSSKVFSPEELQPIQAVISQQNETENEDEEALLVGHIQEIQKEKELLTSALPSLTRTTSDDDMLSTDLDGEGSLDDISCAGQMPGHSHITEACLRRPGNVTSMMSKGPVVRSISGGDATSGRIGEIRLGEVVRVGDVRHLKRQSSDLSVQKGAVDDCSEDLPIMV